MRKYEKIGIWDVKVFHYEFVLTPEREITSTSFGFGMAVTRKLKLKDMFMGFEEIDGDDDIREEFPCPFCSEYFLILLGCVVTLMMSIPWNPRTGVFTISFIYVNS
ncbi:hypothetical protein NC652_012512 [Populus alba x Populus x berolinensis]|nr:hypothetical protein NC652_012512 [Populus alba x Populus x berolinensis]